MAGGWINLPAEILITIAGFLDTEVDLLRLRSVCSHWRKSVPPRVNRCSFPLMLPNLPPPALIDVQDSAAACFLIKQNTLFRLSPPAYGDCAGDTSDGWLLKVSDAGQPNRFRIVNPISPELAFNSEGIIPKNLNLLKFRVSEILQSYSIEIVVSSERRRPYLDWKALVFKNYVIGFDFLVMILPTDDDGIYIWRSGEEIWTRIGPNRAFHDVIKHAAGKYYVVDEFGYIFSFDRNLNMTLVCNVEAPLAKSCFAKRDSDLYVISRHDSEFLNYLAADRGEGYVHMPSKMQIWNVTNMLEVIHNGILPTLRNCCDDLEGNIFLMGNDACVGVSPKDFAGCKGNYMCLIDDEYFDEEVGGVYGENTGVYDFGEYRIKSFVEVPECAKTFWPPPSWIMDHE